MGGFVTILYFLTAAFEIYMLNELAKSLLEKQALSYQAESIIWFIAIGLLTALNNRNNTTANLIGVPLIYVTFVLLKFQAGMLKRVSVAFCFYMLIIGPEFIFAMMNQVNQNPGYRPGESVGINTYIMMLIMKSMTFIMVKCIGQIHRTKQHNQMENRVFGMLMVLPLATIFFFLSIFYANIRTTGKSMIMLMAGVIFLLFSNVFMFYIFDKLAKAHEKACNMELLFLKSSIEKKHYHNLEKVNHRHRELLHDINKYLRTAGELLQEGNQKAAGELFEQVGVRIRETGDVTYAVNPLLNAIIAERKNQADEWGITCQIQVDADVSAGFIEDLDLIALLGNLLDNALEAARQVTADRYVSIRMYMSNQQHFLSLEVENSILNVPIKQNNRYVTTKTQKDEHGIGLATVEKLVQKYQGMMRTTVTGHVFCAAVTLPVSPGNV